MDKVAREIEEGTAPAPPPLKLIDEFPCADCWLPTKLRRILVSCSLSTLVPFPSLPLCCCLCLLGSRRVGRSSVAC